MYCLKIGPFHQYGIPVATLESYAYYCANEEWQSRDILFTVAEYIVQYYP